MSIAPFTQQPLATAVIDDDVEIESELFVEPNPPSSRLQKFVVSAVIFGPFAGLLLAVIDLWGSSIRPVDVITAAIFYVVSGLGITIGFHRMLTHKSFVAKRWLRIALAIAGSFAVQGSVTSWVAIHRRHHVYSDRPGDPHSPNLFGTDRGQMFKGFIHAHAGWLYASEQANALRWAPDLLADDDIAKVTAYAPLWSVLTFLLPFIIGLAATGSFSGAWQCFLWAGLVRILVLHHVTWSTNSICHIFGKRPFATKDLSRNFAPFALLSFGEAWHNGHHAFPSSARHGVDKGQADISARLIRIFECLNWVSSVRWPEQCRVEARRIPACTSIIP